MSHQEKQAIFDRYANSKGYESFFEIIHDYAYLGKPNEILNHCFAVCDLVQEEQQKRIAESITMKYHDGSTKKDSFIEYYQIGADNITVDK